MTIFSFGYRVGERGVSIDKIEGIVRQFAEVVTDGFIGAMDSRVERRIVEIYPVGFVCARLYLRVHGKVEVVRIRGDLSIGERDIRRVRRRNTIIAIRLWRGHFSARHKHYSHDAQYYYFSPKAHFTPNYGTKVAFIIQNSKFKIQNYAFQAQNVTFLQKCVRALAYMKKLL